jgi:PIN domain nuclease of toxin-antitoxin system
VILRDTHAAVWFITDDPALGQQSRLAADSALSESQLTVSAVTFWEIAMLISKGRMKALRSPTEQRTKILDAGIRELPLTGDIAIIAVELAALHGDPADRFIVASAIAHNATLMTADAALLRWSHAIGRQDAAT